MLKLMNWKVAQDAEVVPPTAVGREASRREPHNIGEARAWFR